jgi:hypothetical protein
MIVKDPQPMSCGIHMIMKSRTITPRPGARAACQPARGHHAPLQYGSGRAATDLTP